MKTEERSLSRRACSFTIHIVDSDVHSASANGWLEDVSKVEKYRISEEAYNARQDTYRRAAGASGLRGAAGPSGESQRSFACQLFLRRLPL